MIEMYFYYQMEPKIFPDYSLVDSTRMEATRAMFGFASSHYAVTFSSFEFRKSSSVYFPSVDST